MKPYRKQKSWAAMSFLGAALAGQAQSLPKAPSAPAPPPQVVAVPDGANILVWGNGGFSSLDLGHISWAQGNPPAGFSRRKDHGSFDLTTRIGVRANCGAAGSGHLASVRVSLAQPDQRYSVLLDGTILGTSPMIANAVPCGSTTEHTFEVNVPVTAPAGSLNVTLVFEVSPQ